MSVPVSLLPVSPGCLYGMSQSYDSGICLVYWQVVLIAKGWNGQLYASLCAGDHDKISSQSGGTHQSRSAQLSTKEVLWKEPELHCLKD